MTIPTLELPQLDAAIRRGARIAMQSEPASARDAERQKAIYLDNLTHYRLVASDCVASGDHRQAAEKSWGAFAQAIKAAAAAHGVVITTHVDVLGVAMALANLVRSTDPGTGQRLESLVYTARSLHQHFYENDLPSGAVPRAAANVLEAADQIGKLSEVRH